jgi:hypothetical protein
MKCERSKDNGRVLIVSDLPDTIDGIGGSLTELEILVNYTGSPGAHKAVPLDSIIIPAIMRALNKKG